MHLCTHVVALHLALNKLRDCSEKWKAILDKCLPSGYKRHVQTDKTSWAVWMVTSRGSITLVTCSFTTCPLGRNEVVKQIK